jgi:hypothetical protein
MKAFLLTWLVVCSMALRSQSQISVEIQLDQRQFLRNESLPVKVRLLNRSGQAVKLGEVPDWLSFSVETRDGKPVNPVEPILAGGNFDLESAESVTKQLDLATGYDFSQPGSYRVTALVRFPKLNFSATSSTQPFDIVRGSQIWQEVCGIPVTNGPPRWITYSLIQANHVKQLKLYVRVAEEPEGGFVRVLPLGQVVAFAKPEQMIDRSSALHILYQTGPRSFEYCEVAPTGLLTQRTGYTLTPYRPRLTMDDSGKITVKGGVSQAKPAWMTNVPPPIKATNSVPTKPAK